MAQHVPRHLLLTIPGCCVECAGIVYRGTLVLEYIAVAPTGQLVLRVGAFETLVARTQPVVHQRARGIYKIPGVPAPATLRVPLVARNLAARVVLNAFSVLLARYAVVRDVYGGGDERQVDDQVVVVALSGSVPAQDDTYERKKPSLVADPPAPPELHVCPLLPEETAALLQTAHALSRGIAFARTTLAAGMARAYLRRVHRAEPHPCRALCGGPARHRVVQRERESPSVAD